MTSYTEEEREIARKQVNAEVERTPGNKGSNTVAIRLRMELNRLQATITLKTVK